MIFSWPPGLSVYFTQLTMKYFDEVLFQNVYIDMLQDTIANITNPGDPAYLTIFSGRSATSAVPVSSGTPDRFELFQNYPNPFNPATVIKYDLPKSTRVTLKIYDVLGREAATLKNGEERAGNKSAEWNATHFASGVYYYRLQAGDFTATRKLLLLK
jgi:hypothetical protein